MGSGDVSSEKPHYLQHVIPAEAGIQFCALSGKAGGRVLRKKLGSRLRGSDGNWMASVSVLATLLFHKKTPPQRG
jgi:hypothetical protein